jgi:DNA-binding GntR family transcriptional regulator
MQPGLSLVGDRRQNAKVTLAEDLRRQIADEIMAGRLHPGMRLDEQELAGRYNVSRTPVREALKLLAATGLIESRPRKGVVVAVVTAERMSEMFEVMGELEASCARLAALRMTAEEKTTLAGLHRRGDALRTAGDPDLYDQVNTDFHSLIYAATHNRFLEETAQAMRARLRPFRRAQFRVAGRLDQSWREHDSVVRAILLGDGEMAYYAMRAHVSAVGNASADYMAHLPGHHPASS